MAFETKSPVVEGVFRDVLILARICVIMLAFRKKV